MVTQLDDGKVDSIRRSTQDSLELVLGRWMDRRGPGCAAARLSVYRVRGCLNLLFGGHGDVRLLTLHTISPLPQPRIVLASPPAS